MLLIRIGHVIEAGVLFRTIDEFIGDIDFLDASIKNGSASTVDQKKFIESYFIDHSQAEELLQAIPPKKKARAAEARATLPENPDRAVKMLSAIDSMWNAYVHGDYQTSMEMYYREEAAPESAMNASEGFHVHGMWGASRRISVFRWYLARHTNNAFNAMFKVAVNIGLTDIAHELHAKRTAFNETKAYTDQIEIRPLMKPCPNKNDFGGSVCEHSGDVHDEMGVCREWA